MRFEWPQTLSQQDMERMVALINTVSLRESTLCFYEEIPLQTGVEMMRELVADIQKGRCHLLIARNDEGHIVGMVTVAPLQLPGRRHIAELRRGVIDPDYRGLFISSMGFEQALRKAQSLGCEMVILDVHGGSKAEVLWRHLGFKEYGKMEDYSRIRDRVVTGYYMYAHIKDVLAHREQSGSLRYRPESQR